MSKISFFIIGFFLFLLALPTKAAFQLDIVVNEIAWMGTGQSFNDEWVELYNNSDSSFNLGGWKLVAEDGTPEINLEGEILGKGFFLLERTDDETVPDVKADLIYKGALNNEGEYLKLIDNDGKIIDEINCSAGWFAGDNKTKQTIERKNSHLPGNNSDNWQTSQNSNGTPKAENSATLAQLESEPVQEPKTEPQTEPPSEPEPITYPSDVFLNEILPSPEGPDETEEWIEILNQNNFEINLVGWKIEDILGKTTTYIFPKETKISPKSFLVLSRPTTKITLNNDADGLNFIQPDGKIVDSVSYEKAPRGQSYNRIDSSWVWSTILTPGSANIIPVPKQKEKTGAVSPKDKIGENDNGFLEEKRLAAVSKTLPKSSNPLRFFLIASGIAIFSGAIVLILKNKLKKNYNKNI